MKRVLPSCLLLTITLLSPAQANSPMPAHFKHASLLHAKDGVFHSVSLDRDMKYRILLPRGYENGSGRFPVLYLLHGLYGDYLNWDTRTNLEHYAENLSVIVVMPDADDSWYTNSSTDPKDRFEDYIARDLISEIDAKYRTIRSRQARAIAGLSMGGYGAIKLALKYPDSFIVAGSLSGALDAGGGLDKRVAQFHDQLVKVFGAGDSATRRDNDLFLLIEKADPSRLPYLYLACGEQDDHFLETNRRFAAQLSAHKVAYEYHETAGAHDWDYWDRSVRRMLPAVMDALSNFDGVR